MREDYTGMSEIDTRRQDVLAETASQENTEDLRVEENTAPEASTGKSEPPAPLWDMVIQLTAEEIRACLQRADRRRMGLVRVIVYAVILGFVAVASLVSFFMTGMQSGMSLFLGIGGLILLLLVVLYEPVQLHQMVKREAAAGKKLHVWVYEDTLGFGEADTFETYSFSEFYTRKFDDMLILHFAGGLLVAIPRRCVSAECWEFLYTHLRKRNLQENGGDGTRGTAF